MKANQHKICHLFIIVITSLINCACSTQGYWSDRGRDALDIVTIGVGMGVGAKAQVGPIQTGALIEADAVTLRGAELSKGGLKENGEWQLVAIGQQQFITSELSRNKNFSASTTIDDTTIPFVHRLMCPDKAAYWYYTQLEAVLGVGPALRLGLNPGELVDFILGWLSIDIMSDDLMTDAPKDAQDASFGNCPIESKNRKLALE